MKIFTYTHDDTIMAHSASSALENGYNNFTDFVPSSGFAVGDICFVMPFDFAFEHMPDRGDCF